MNVTDTDESEELDQTKADESQPALNNSSDLGAKEKRRRKKKSESHPTNSASTLKLVQAVESTPALPTPNANPEKSARNRSKGLLAPGTPKRPREVGATPPSIEQLTKRPVASSSSDQSLAGSSTAQPNIATTLGTPDSVTNRLIGLKNSLQQKQLTDGGTPGVLANAKTRKIVRPSKLATAGHSSGRSAPIKGTPAQSDKIVQSFGLLTDAGQPTTGSNHSVQVPRGNETGFGNRAVNEGAGPSRPTPGSLYASVTSEQLVVAVADLRTSDEVTLLTPRKFDTLQSRLNTFVIAQIGKIRTPPGFEETRLVSGVMRIRCRDM